MEPHPWSGSYHVAEHESAAMTRTSASPHPVPSDFQASSRANADILLWQSPVRIAAAVVAGGVAYLLQQAGLLAGGGGGLLAAVGAYVAFVMGVRGALRHRARAGAWLVAAVILADLALV